MVRYVDSLSDIAMFDIYREFRNIIYVNCIMRRKTRGKPRRTRRRRTRKTKRQRVIKRRNTRIKLVKPRKGRCPKGYKPYIEQPGSKMKKRCVEK